MNIDGITSDLTVEELIFAACRGGWPASLDRMRDEVKLMIAKDYVEIICQEDVSKVDKVNRDPTLARLILRSYARNLCTLAKKTSMLADISVERKGSP